MRQSDRVKHAINLLQGRMPRSVLKSGTIKEVYLLLTNGKPFKPKRRYRKRAAYGGKTPILISSAYIYRKFGWKV